MSHDVQQIVSELRGHLLAEYGERLVNLVLFGSEARGDADPNSDIDLLVVLKGPVQVSREIARVGQFKADLCLKYGRVIGSVFMDEQRYLAGGGPLLRNIAREGVAV